jgi:hypothetical protein
MKKKYIFMMLLALTAASCKKDYLDLHPLDTQSPDKFYQTDAQIKSAVAAAYVPLRDLENYDFFCTEMRSDNTHYQNYPSNRGTAYTQRENVSDWQDDANNVVTNALYWDCYLSISRANIIIGRLPQAASATAAVIANVDGQAKFLRAWNYFKLVKLFGGVPLYLTEVTKAEDAFVKRSTVDQVYAQIVADASDAVRELSVPTFPQTGAATKGSATMLLAEVYMNQKKYVDAEALLTSLAGMGYALNATYASAFLTTNKNSKESLFEVQFIEGTAAGTAPSNFIYQFLPRITTSTLITGNTTATATTGGWNTPSPDLIATYEANDTRLDASIGIAEGTYNASDQLVVTANKSAVGYVAPAGKVGVPYAKKYLHTPHVANNNTNDNWPIYRYSDALLLLAEAQNEQGKSPLIALNTVRARAFGDALHNITATDQTILRGLILKERRVELAFENHRWDDLKRSGTVLAVMQAYAVKAKSTYYTAVPASAFNITTEKLIYPIPLTDIGLNPGLTQNPGYN